MAEVGVESMIRIVSSFSSRRSHLDSASYRTLHRIFSLCHDNGQTFNPRPNPNPSSDSAPNGDSKPAEEFGLGGPEKGAAFTDDPNPCSQSAEGCADEGIQKGATFTKTNLQVLDAFKELDSELVDDTVDTAVLEDFTSDCTKLIDGDDDALGQIGVNLEVNNRDKDVNFEKGTTIEVREETELSPLVSDRTGLRDAMQNSSDESKHEDESKEHGECFNREAVAFEKSAVVEEAREINLSDGEVDREDFEEGEISEDPDNLNQPLDLEQEPASQEAEKREEGSVRQLFDENQNPSCTVPLSSKLSLVDGGSRTKENWVGNGSPNTLIGAGSNVEFEAVVDDSRSNAAKVDFNTANKKKEKPYETELVEVRVKKKTPLSKERKAKKKIAKKRKKAQKERAQGVKRLKLQPIMKPKEVKICNFYLIGRCQKGDSCKFSHDTIPKTKSQPCNFFARNSCLKGEECPFDHELSKYPCHNYMTEGMCHRGDGCKFSHKLPATEPSPPAAVASKADPRLSSGNSNSTNMNRSAPKQPMQIPNGISFLSFGKGPSATADSKVLGDQQKQENLAAGHRNGLIMAKPKVPRHATAADTTDAYKKSKDKNLQTEVSEASKLLEEFLFSSTG